MTNHTTNYKQQMINLLRKGESMASIGEHLHALATTAKEMIDRVEKEPLNVPDTIESNDWKSKKDYINKIADRTQNI